jgi:O-antigen biosynthesis protein WbqV
MTIPEAVQLILQTSLLPEFRGRIAMLDMGEPVRIRDLAVNLLRLSGVRGDLEDKIVYTGLRLGEKLHEQLVAPDEQATMTAINKVRLLETSSGSAVGLQRMLADWEFELKDGGRNSVYAAFARIFPDLGIRLAIALLGVEHSSLDVRRNGIASVSQVDMRAVDDASPY